MVRYSRITGMNDVLLDQQPYWRCVLDHVQRVADLYGYRRIDVPVMEVTSLFVRGVGEGTDIVDKEMYSFEDRDGTSVSLRPEFTAGIMRAYIENGMHVLPSPLKVWTAGPLFRHEKPQAGRYRQHSQFDIEVIGEQDPAVDLEVINVAWHLFRELGFTGLRLQINSTGCPQCKPAYVQKLVDYFTPLTDQLAQVDRLRLRKNPLRILDSKEKSTQPLLNAAPYIVDYLCSDCADHFVRLRRYLDTQGRSYQVNYRIVRGLDYYTKTVFEIKADGLGAQDTICGGGRYDGLIQELGGRATPGIGFGSGIERIVLAMQQIGLEVPEEPAPSVMVAYRGEPAKLVAIPLVESLRQTGIGALLAFGDRSLKAQMKSANRADVWYTVILGEEELQAKEATVRDMRDSQQVTVPFSQLESWLRDRIASEA
ncbi:MAG: histidine--tRNA ligase [Ardenticatenia bacterium]|nr:histidine--tRNA ligase [Ardenticatenia bacterium]